MATNQRKNRKPKGTSIHDLNDDCLIAIADYLDVIDWLNLYDTSQRFRKIILEGIVPRKFIDFEQICQHTMYTDMDAPCLYMRSYDAQNIFQRFGKVLTKFGISDKCISFKRPENTEFDEFLQFLLDYCTNGAFREVHIELNPLEEIRSDLINRTASYFKNVTKLKIKTTRKFKMYSFGEWLSVIPKQNLQYLELNGIPPFSSLFELISCALPKLDHLKLKNYRLNDVKQTKMLSFLEKMPHIRSFYTEDQATLLFSNHIECIGKLHVTQLPRVAKQLKESTKNLKCLVLQGRLRDYRDFDAAFKIIAEKSTLKKLVIEICSSIGPQPVNDELNAFCQTVRNKQFIDCLHVFCEPAIRDLTQKYFDYLISKVFECKTFILNSNKNMNTKIVQSIIRNGSRMETLSLMAYIEGTPAIYKKIVEERKKVIAEPESQKPLNIFFIHANHWLHKITKSVFYKPEIVSITSIPHKEIEYF